MAMGTDAPRTRPPRSRTGRARSRCAAAAVVGTVLLGVLASCTTSRASGVPTPVAQVAASADCLAPRVLDELGLHGDVLTTRSPHGDVPDSGRVPDDFVAVAVLACEVDGTLRDGDGVWSAVTATRLEGDLDGLLTALGVPSATPTGTCTSPPEESAVLWLVDAMGRAVRPTWPTDRCGAPQPGVAEALADLEETGRDTYRAVLVQATAPGD